MCYAFREAMEPLHIRESIVHLGHPEQVPASTSTGADPPTTSSKKRSAEDALEKQPAKSKKLDDDDVVEISEPGKASASEEKLRKKVTCLQSRLDRAEVELKQQKAECKYYQDQHDDVLCRLAEYEAKQGKQPLPKTEQAQARALGKAMVQLERKKIKAECSETIDVLKKKYQRKVDELKGTCERKIQDLKDLQEEQTKTKEAACRKKVQKAEEDAKGLKPEHSKAVKEKDTALKSKDKEIANLKSSLGDLEKEKATLEDRVTKFEEEKKTFEKAMADKDSACASLRSYLDTRSADLRRSTQESAYLQTARVKDKADLQIAHAKEKSDLQIAHAKRIEHEGERSMKQYNRAEQLARDLLDQQRAVFVLRHGIDREVKKNTEMQSEISALKEQLRGYEKEAKNSDCVEEEERAKGSESGSSEFDMGVVPESSLQDDQAAQSEG